MARTGGEGAKRKEGRRSGLQRFLGDNSLSLALFGLFLACLAAQAVTGWQAFNRALKDAGLRPMAFPAYLGSGDFLDGIFSNWEAAILQLAVLIAFSSVLRQKGAAHSKKAGGGNRRKFSLNLNLKSSPMEWLKANSLSLAFGAMFAATFLLHALFGSWKHDEEQMLRHLPPSPFDAYLTSAGFWASVFQCWQAEFGAIGLYIVLSICLRQEGSSESKPTEASNAETGETNK
jgi:hypothetical protein